MFNLTTTEYLSRYPTWDLKETFRDRIRSQGTNGLKNNWRFLIQIAEEMKYLHDHNLLHRNLHLNGVFILQDRAIVGGLSQLTSIDNKTDLIPIISNQSFYDVLSYEDGLHIQILAPEILLNSQAASKASDMWAFGILVWSAWNNGCLPYGQIGLETNNRKELILREMRFGRTPPIKRDDPLELQQLLRDCWQFNPQDRPLFDDNFLDRMRTLEPIINEFYDQSLPPMVLPTNTYASASCCML